MVPWGPYTAECRVDFTWGTWGEVYAVDGGKDGPHGMVGSLARRAHDSGVAVDTVRSLFRLANVCHLVELRHQRRGVEE